MNVSPFDSALPRFAPRCVVDVFMLKMISCVLSHVLVMKHIIEETDDYDYEMQEISCERFLGIGWQADFFKRFVQPVDSGVAGDLTHNLISLNEDSTSSTPLMDRLDPRFRQAFPSTVTLVNECEDINLTQVLPIGTIFKMSDISHSM